MTQTRNILPITILLLGTFFAVTFSSCHKSQPDNTTITYVNDTYTPINITLNGSSQTIPVGGSVSYIGSSGSNADVIASTAGSYGVQINWSFTDVFPVGAGLVTEPLDVSANYFYLQVINTYSFPTTALEVNVGLGAQTTENMTISNNGNVYGVGYYLAYGNTAVKAFYTDLTTWTSGNLSIPNTINASYTLSLQ